MGGGARAGRTPRPDDADSDASGRAADRSRHRRGVPGRCPVRPSGRLPAGTGFRPGGEPRRRDVRVAGIRPSRRHIRGPRRPGAVSPSRTVAPLVFAHRGASDDLPEHTLEAYHRAIEQGADGLECDVRLTRDRQLVCIHDGRLDRTSNGTGRVSTATLADLQGLDFGSWHPRYQTDSGQPARVLTLDRLLAAVVEYNRPLRLLIETKHPTRYGSAVEIQVMRMLRQYGLIGGV